MKQLVISISSSELFNFIQNKFLTKLFRNYDQSLICGKFRFSYRVYHVIYSDIKVLILIQRKRFQGLYLLKGRNIKKLQNDG